MIGKKENLMQAVLEKAVDGKKIFGTSFAIKQGDKFWTGNSGNISKGQPYFIASTTKLFTTAIILRLRSEGKLNLDDLISKYFDENFLKGLHVYKSKEYSKEIRIRHLLSHTSGLPDYFQNKGSDGESLEHTIKKGNDRYWTFEQAIDRTREMKALFAPGTKYRAHYSDSNFQLLGRIIEIISGRSFSENCVSVITAPLGLTQTYLYKDENDRRPKTLYYKTTELNIPKAMSSFGPDGGMVSDSEEMLVFIEAFFSGKLFPADYIQELQIWNRIFFPMQSGIGIHLFKLPWFFNPFGAVPSFIGHSGLSGALAFYSPKDNLFITGTVNQVAYPDISFRTMIKLAMIMNGK